VKQLNLFEPDNAPNSSKENLLMTKEELIQWKNRIYEQQKQARLRTKTEQPTLFEIAQNTRYEADDIDPLKLKPYPADFYRMPPALQYLNDQGCIYFLIDYFAEIILYIGETKLSAYRRWIGEHYAKKYTLSYIERHRQDDLECSVCCTFWLDVPPQKKILLQMESELISKWRSPFNRQMWEIYGQPFKRYAL
jgi:hypothetical protein